MKAEDTITINLTGKTAFADFMVVSTGRSNRQVGAIADRMVDDLREAGVPDVRIEGTPLCDWVLIDAGDVVVHVFRPEVRAFYSLEKMWSAPAPKVSAASLPAASLQGASRQGPSAPEQQLN
jgi:ribosome-associated protein